MRFQYHFFHAPLSESFSKSCSPHTTILLLPLQIFLFLGHQKLTLSSFISHNHSIFILHLRFHPTRISIRTISQKHLKLLIQKSNNHKSGSPHNIITLSNAVLLCDLIQKISAPSNDGADMQHEPRSGSCKSALFCYEMPHNKTTHNKLFSCLLSNSCLCCCKTSDRYTEW